MRAMELHLRQQTALPSRALGKSERIRLTQSLKEGELLAVKHEGPVFQDRHTHYMVYSEGNKNYSWKRLGLLLLLLSRFSRVRLCATS